MNTRILFPTDFSERSQQALAYALRMTGQGQMEDLWVTLLHVDVPMTALHPEVGAYVDASEHDKIVQSKREKLSAMASKWKEAFPEVTFKDLYVEGPVATKIREVAVEQQIDLIAMGVSGLNAIERTIIGSTAVSLSKNSPCPVLIVPEQAEIKTPNKVILATDFKNLLDVHILDPLKDVVTAHDMDLMLLHIYRDEKAIVDENVDLVEELSNYFDTPKFDYFFLEDKDKLTAIQDFVSGYRGDLLTVVAHERKFFQDLFHQSLRRKLVFHSKVPVLVLHPIFWGSDDESMESFREKTQAQLGRWRAEIDRMHVQAHLGRIEASQDMTKRREAMEMKLGEVRAKIDDAGVVARDKWQHFHKEIAQALNHVKRAFSGPQ